LSDGVCDGEGDGMTLIIERSPDKFFQGLRMNYIVQNRDGIDQGYQSHQFLTKSEV